MSSTVTIRPDGSGTITERVTVSSELSSMMRGMQQMGDSTDTSEKLFSEKDVRAGADSLSGVRLKSTKMVSTLEKEGYQAVYAFGNLNEAQLSPSPDDVMSARASQESGEGDPSELLSQIDMSFTPGTPATLTITMPRDTSGEEGLTGDSFSMDTPREGPPSNQQMRMIRQMMKDTGLRLAVTIDGEIVGTNATTPLWIDDHPHGNGLWAAGAGLVGLRSTHG